MLLLWYQYQPRMLVDPNAYLNWIWPRVCATRGLEGKIYLSLYAFDDKSQISFMYWNQHDESPYWIDMSEIYIYARRHL